MKIFPLSRILIAAALAVGLTVAAVTFAWTRPPATTDTAPSASPPSATSVGVTPPNGTSFTDVNGDPIHAHGGGMLEHEGVYYWVGENRNAQDRFGAVSLYSSPDLVTWTFEHDILTQASSPELSGATIERPKLLYNQATATFVLWMHWENGTDYSQARTAVATSSTVAGDYVYQGSSRPLGFESRDQTVFQDDQGNAYLASATASNADLNLYRLSDDFTRPVELLTTLWPGAFREAPALFQRDGIYYLITSGATGWDANQAMYSTATDPTGPWSDLAPFGDAEAFGSQAAFVLPVTGATGTDYLYLGDRWAGARGGLVNESDYVWLPLDFPNGTGMSMQWADSLSISVADGTVQSRGGGTAFRTFTSASNGLCLDAAEGGDAVIFWPCSGASNQQWQSIALSDTDRLLRSRSTGDCLAVAAGGVALTACESSPEQRMKVRAGADALELIETEDGCLLVGAGAVATLGSCDAATRFDPIE